MTGPAERVRGLALALPQAAERGTWGATTYRVGERIFAVTTSDAASVTCKVPPGLREVLLESAPRRFFIPPYFGTKGWVAVRLDDGCDWDELRDLLEGSYALVAPKRLAAQVRRNT